MPKTKHVGEHVLLVLRRLGARPDFLPDRTIGPGSRWSKTSSHSYTKLKEVESLAAFGGRPLDSNEGGTRHVAPHIHHTFS
jgi:hypothetical protein